jgi:hypothetical protein
MYQARMIVVALGVASAALAGFANPSLAQKQSKKLSYDEAWTICKKFVDTSQLSWDAHGQRYSRGAACMKKYGYRI